MKYIISGSAPLDPNMLNFLKGFFKCPILQGYGLTECSTNATLSDENNDLNNGNVGKPLCYTEIKLVDVPELNYFSSDKPNPRGEIYIRGPTVFQGYYKDIEKT